MTHLKMFEEQKISKLLLKLALPAIMSMLVVSMYNIVDTLFISKSIGIDALAGVNLVFPIQLLIFTIAITIGIGASTLISVELGKNNISKAETILGKSLALSIIIGLFIMVLFLVFQDNIIQLLGASGDSFLFAKDYLSIILFGTLFTFINMSLNPIVRSTGLAKLILIVVVSSSILNIFLDYVFINRLLLGTFGAGLATVISQLLITIILLYLFLRNKIPIKLKFNKFFVDSKLSLKILKIGLPTFFKHSSFFVMVFFANILILKEVGLMGISAFGISQKLIMLVFMPANGLVQGMIPITGYSFGAKLTKRLKEAFHLTIKYATTILLITSLLVILFAPQLSVFFTKDASLIEMTTKTIRVLFLGCVFAGYTIVAGSYLQSIKKPFVSAFISALRLLILFVPIVLLFSHFWSWEGILWAFPFIDLISLPITYLIMRRYNDI